MITITQDADWVIFEISRPSGTPERVYFPCKPENYRLKGVGALDYECGDSFAHLRGGGFDGLQEGSVSVG